MSLALIEVHDVTPYYYEEVSYALDLLSLCGVEKFSLLIVPNFWDKTPLYKHPQFVRAMLATNQEIVLHGFNHKGGSLKDILWTYREGEFSNLCLYSTYAKIYEAEEMLETFGIKTEIFVPPAWIGNPFLEDVIYSLGFSAIAYRGYVKDLNTDTSYTSPVISFSNRPIIDSFSKAFVPFLFKLFKRYRLLRLAIHPRDLRDREKVKLWRFLLSKVRKIRRLVSYEEFLSKSGLAFAL